MADIERLGGSSAGPGDTTGPGPRSDAAELSAPQVGGRSAPDEPVTARAGPEGDVGEESGKVVRGLFGRDSLYMVLWAIQLVLVSLLTPVISRVLGETSYGHAAAAFAVMQVLFPIAGLSLPPAIQRAFSRSDGGERDARALVATSIVSATAITVIVLLTGLLWSPAVGFNGFPAAVEYAVIWAGLCGITYAGLGLLKSQDRLGWFAAVTLTQSLVAEVTAVCLAAFVSATASTYLFGQMICQAAAALLAIVATRPRAARLRDLPLVQDAVRYSVSLIPAGLAVFVFDTSDRLIIQSDLGAGAVGRYVIARNIGALAIVLVAILSDVWMPRLFSIDDDGLRREVLAVSRDATFRLVEALILAVVFASPVLLWIMAPPSYHTDSLFLITALIAMSALPAAGVQASVRVLLLTDRTFAIAVCTTVAAAANLGLNLVVVPWLGIEGAALVSLCAYGLQFLMLHLSAQRSISLPAPSPRLLLAIAVGVGVCLATTLMLPSPATIAARMVLALACAGFFCFGIVQVVMPERAQALRQFVRSLRAAVPFAWP